MKNKSLRPVIGRRPGCGRHCIQCWDAPDTQTPGRLRVAVHADFPPYSAKGKGIDIEIGKELARRMGMEPEVIEYTADEDMSDDLRNMVWKGHYLGTRPADVMLHVPVDKHLADNNEQVRIFAPYHVESFRGCPRSEADPAGHRFGRASARSIYPREDRVETASLADDFLMSVMNGRLRQNVMHFTTVAQAVQAMKQGQIGAVMAARTEVESAVGTGTAYEISAVTMPELRIKGWALGLAVKAGNDPLAEALGKAMGDRPRWHAGEDIHG